MQMFDEDGGSILKILMGTAALFIIIYGLKESQQIIVPILLATFFAIILSAPMKWLEKKRVPSVVALIAVVVLAVVVITIFVNLIGGSLGEFNSKLPYYQERAQTLWQQFGAWLNIGNASDEFFKNFDPTKYVGFASTVICSLTGVLTNSLLIFFTMLLMLMETASFEAKFGNADGSSPAVIHEFTTSIRSYLGLKTIVSFGTGVLVWIMAAAIGVDFPVLWGLLAFLFNFIPNIGSFIAAVPAVLVALIQLGGQSATIFALGYVAINMIIGNIVEPKLMGKGMDLSVLVVFLSLMFWGWVFGPVGMLLSVPLTLALKLALNLNPNSEKFARILSSGNPKKSA